MRLKIASTALLCALMTTAAFGQKPKTSKPASAPEVTVPDAKREFRAAWVATVANIDWPSKRGLSSSDQQAEIIAILDRTAELNMNGIVLQVRPACDTIYPSELEPWSDIITGVQGQAPEPFYDPLQMWVEEAHKRGIEVHCWFNPYRAKHPTTKGALAEGFIGNKHPEIVKEYGDYLWLDPASKITQDHSMAVVLDVVKRYDIDGVHMDDYFYPYKSYAKNADFPDDESWAAYQKTGGKLGRDDWRRDSVNKFVERFYRETKAAKPHVKVGISPFGIASTSPEGKPAEVTAGFDQFKELYADAKLWLNKGWVDYYTPQLYWKTNSPQSYPYLVKWWMEQNTKDRHIWPGLYTSKYAEVTSSVEEIANQVVLTRFAGANGNVHFSMKPLMHNVNNVNEILTSTVYAEKALIPAMPWIESKPPAAPVLSLDPEDAATTASDEGTSPVRTANISWPEAKGEKPFVYAVYTRKGSKWNVDVLPGTSTSLSLKSDAKGVLPSHVAISAVDRNGNESRKTLLQLGSEQADAKPKNRVDQVQ